MKKLSLLIMFLSFEKALCNESDSIFKKSEEKSFSSKIQVIKVKDKAQQLWSDLTSFVKDKVTDTKNSVASYRKDNLPDDLTAKIDTFKTAGISLQKKLNEFAATLKQLPSDQNKIQAIAYSNTSRDIDSMLDDIEDNVTNLNTARKMLDAISPRISYVNHSLQVDQFVKQDVQKFNDAFNSLKTSIENAENSVFKKIETTSEKEK